MAINKAINNTALLEMIPTGNVSVMNGDNGQSVNPVENGHPTGDKISIMELENCQNECISRKKDQTDCGEGEEPAPIQEFVGPELLGKRAGLCTAFHEISNPFNVKHDPSGKEEGCNNFGGKRRRLYKQQCPVKAVDKRSNFIGMGPPAHHMKFNSDTSVRVVRSYLEYFNWKQVLVEAGIPVPAKTVRYNDYGTEERGGGLQERTQSISKSSVSPIPRTPSADSTSSLNGALSVSGSGTGSSTNNTPSTPSATPTGTVKERKPVLLPARRMSVNGGNHSRICSSCGTSKTPYWRDGWGGPVVLCNACGLRYQKFKKYCLTCKYIPRKEEHSSERCTNCKNNWK